MNITWVNQNATHRDRGNWKSACGRWLIKPGGGLGYRSNKHNDYRLLEMFLLVDTQGEFQTVSGLVGELKRKAALYPG